MTKYDKIFKNIVLEIANLSNCVSKHVGAIIVKEGRIISIGYNGTPAGYKNCNEIFDKNQFVRFDHAKFSDCYEIHAELNAIIWAAKKGISVENSTLYCTYHPCWQCSKNIIQSGIKEVYYINEYDRIDNIDALIQFYKDCNIKLEKMEI